MVALAATLSHVARYTTDEMVAWWVGAAPENKDRRAERWIDLSSQLKAGMDRLVGGRDEMPHRFRDAAAELLATSGPHALLEVTQDVLFRAIFNAADGEHLEDTVEQAGALNARYPRAGILVQMFSGDHAVSGGWAEEIPLFGLETVDDVRSAPAMHRWLGDRLRSDEGDVDFIAAALAILSSDWHASTIATMDDQELLEFWAGGSHYAVTCPLRPQLWPPRPGYWRR